MHPQGVPSLSSRLFRAEAKGTAEMREIPRLEPTIAAVSLFCPSMALLEPYEIALPLQREEARRERGTSMGLLAGRCVSSRVK